MPSKCVCGEEKARHIDGEMRDRIYEMTTRGAVTVCSGFQAMASPGFVSAAIRRMSPLRRGNLQRRLIEKSWDAAVHVNGAIDGLCACDMSRLREVSTRADALLGRFSALTSGLEVR